ncbi:transporter, putative [Leishmania tarentolae]|uniref:Transporter, putative n=1 Tax=Leishmania tarentolae TaxID=5689 RepID=A0A640KEF2_LEITA|nr:transporter, putative [Leishmania tarentolae]
MGSLHLDVVLITAETVGKILLCTLAGLFVSRYFSSPKETLVGLSYLSERVFLPCLLFANLCVHVTWEKLSKLYWAPLFALVSMGISLLLSALARSVLTRDYHFMVILGSSFQSGVTFPLTVLLNLKGIEWITGDAIVEAQSYIFLYSVVCSIGLWALGDPMIAYAKMKEVDSEDADDEELVGRGSPRNRGVVTDSEAERTEDAQSSPRTVAVGQSAHATAHAQLGWYRPAHASDTPIMLPPGSPSIALNAEMRISALTVTPRNNLFKHLGRSALKSIQIPRLITSIIAVVISLTPPLQQLARSPFGEPFVGGIALMSKGAIPLYLVLLSFSIAASRANDDPVSPRKREQMTVSSPITVSPEPTNADGTILDASAFSPSMGAKSLLDRINSKVQPQILFTCCTVVIRLVITPCICFLVLHILAKTSLIPNEKPFLFSILVAIISPTTINSTRICTMRQYHARDYSHMMFFMHLSSIITSFVWLFCILLYLSD